MPFARFCLFSVLLVAGLSSLLTLSACGTQTQGSGTTGQEQINPFETREERERRTEGSIFGEGGIGRALGFGGQDRTVSETVNKYLWRASMETTQVLPIQRANFSQGIIETTWYAPPGVTGEQMRLVVLVAPGELARNGVRVNAFRRTLGANGQPVDTPVDPRTITALEEAILNRARQLRLEERFG